MKTGSIEKAKYCDSVAEAELLIDEYKDQLDLYKAKVGHYEAQIRMLKRLIYDVHHKAYGLTIPTEIVSRLSVAIGNYDPYKKGEDNET